VRCKAQTVRRTWQPSAAGQGPRPKSQVQPQQGTAAPCLALPLNRPPCSRVLRACFPCQLFSFPTNHRPDSEPITPTCSTGPFHGSHRAWTPARACPSCVRSGWRGGRPEATGSAPRRGAARLTRTPAAALCCPPFLRQGAAAGRLPAFPASPAPAASRCAQTSTARRRAPCTPSRAALTSTQPLLAARRSPLLLRNAARRPASPRHRRCLRALRRCTTRVRAWSLRRWRSWRRGKGWTRSLFAQRCCRAAGQYSAVPAVHPSARRQATAGVGLVVRGPGAPQAALLARNCRAEAYASSGALIPGVPAHGGLAGVGGRDTHAAPSRPAGPSPPPLYCGRWPAAAPSSPPTSATWSWSQRVGAGGRRRWLCMSSPLLLLLPKPARPASMLLLAPRSQSTFCFALTTVLAPVAPPPAHLPPASRRASLPHQDQRQHRQLGHLQQHRGGGEEGGGERGLGMKSTCLRPGRDGVVR
jgi:hypothetical protein